MDLDANRIGQIKILPVKTLRNSLHFILRINQEDIICAIDQRLSDFCDLK